MLSLLVSIKVDTLDIRDSNSAKALTGAIRILAPAQAAIKSLAAVFPCCAKAF